MLEQRLAHKFLELQHAHLKPLLHFGCVGLEVCSSIGRKRPRQNALGLILALPAGNADPQPLGLELEHMLEHQLVHDLLHIERADLRRNIPAAGFHALHGSLHIGHGHFLAAHLGNRFRPRPCRAPLAGHHHHHHGKADKAHEQAKEPARCRLFFLEELEHYGSLPDCR